MPTKPDDDLAPYLELARREHEARIEAAIYARAEQLRDEAKRRDGKIAFDLALLTVARQ